MNWAPLIVAVVIGIIVVPAVRRIRDLTGPPLVLWPALLVATLTPAAMTYILLVPPAPSMTVDMSGNGGKAAL
jgi:hypothetical protein